MKVSCPVCSAKSGKYHVKVEKFDIYKCKDCGLEYTHPMPTDKELKDFYSHYEDVRADSRIVALNAQNNLNILYRYGLKENSNILDFGCGKGDFVQIVGKNCYGVELGFSTHERIFTNLEELPLKSFEFITLWGVLEHINNIKDSMIKLSKYLHKDGCFVMTTVDAEGSIPYYYKPPEHLTYWTKKSLSILAQDLDCEVLEVSPYKMQQFSSIYLERLLSRTPEGYAQNIMQCANNLPEILTVPTNELITVFRKK